MKQADVVDRDPTVRSVAAAMGIREPRGLLNEIPMRAVEKVEKWMVDCGFEPASINDLNRLVLNQTQIHIERIETDDDLVRIKDEYEGELPAIGSQLAFEFEQMNTEALVFQQPYREARYLAIVDARGERRHRAWFSSWHEASHLVVPDPGASAHFRRTRVRRPEPLERVVDAVASAIGFWEPIVRPELKRCLALKGTVLEAFDEVRRRCVPEASRESTYRALVRMVDRPLVLLRVGYGARRSKHTVSQGQESFALRAQTVILNELARRHGMEVWKNFRIPEHSVISTGLNVVSADPLIQDDRLETWVDSRNCSLGPCRVRVVAHGCWATLELAE